jgi:hypothetical protein
MGLKHEICPIDRILVGRVWLGTPLSSARGENMKLIKARVTNYKSIEDSGWERFTRLRPSFCAVMTPIKGSLWGALAFSGVLGSGASGRKHADLEAVLTEATTGVEPV